MEYNLWYALPPPESMRFFVGETRFHWETSRHVPPRPHATRTRRSRATQGTELHRGLSACAGLLLGSPRRRRFCGRPYGKAVPSCVLDLGKVDVHVACRRGVADRIHRVAAGVSVRDCRATGKVDGHAAWVDSGRENRRLSMARSSLRGSGWAPNGPASAPGRAELPRAVRRALRRRSSRARALPRWALDPAVLQPGTHPGAPSSAATAAWFVAVRRLKLWHALPVAPQPLAETCAASALLSSTWCKPGTRRIRPREPSGRGAALPSHSQHARPPPRAPAPRRSRRCSPCMRQVRLKVRVRVWVRIRVRVQVRVRVRVRVRCMRGCGCELARSAHRVPVAM